MHQKLKNGIEVNVPIRSIFRSDVVTLATTNLTESVNTDNTPVFNIYIF